MDDALKYTLQEASKAGPQITATSPTIIDMASPGMSVADFHESLTWGAGRRPVFVMYFTASYECPLCDRLRVTLQTLADKYGARAKFSLFDVMTNTNIMAHQNVTDIPVVHSFLVGKQVHRIGGSDGPVNEGSLTELVKQA